MSGNASASVAVLLLALCAPSSAQVDRFLSRFKGQSWDRFWEHISEKVTESRKTRRYRLVRRDWFQAMVCFVIVLQAGFIGYGAHESFVVHTRGTSPAIWPDIVEACSLSML